jgi:beta-phosphoglucomutase-like phosphatase (HAD superfamily)
MPIDFESEVGFIWDVDGVIVDSPHEMAWRLTAEMAPWNVDEGRLDSGFYHEYVSGSPRYEGGNTILERLGVYERLGAETDDAKGEILEQYCTRKNELFKELVGEGRFEVFETSVAMIVEAYTRGVVQAMASASKNARNLITQITGDHISGIPDTLYSLFEVDASGLSGKSKPEIFAFAAERLHELSSGRIKHYIVFEDAPSGIEAGKENGMFCVGIRRIGDRSILIDAGADIVVDDLGELGYDELKSRFIEVGYRAL